MPAMPATASKLRELPTFYYRSHFLELMGFIESHAAHALRRVDRQFIADFRSLDHDEQCAYVRLVNRKGRVFSRARLDYPELADCRRSFDELLSRGFISAPAGEHAGELVSAATRPLLAELLADAGLRVSSSARKAALSATVLEHLRAEQIAEHLGARGWIVQRHDEAVDFLVFLFFGALPTGTLRFTMRDLGLIRTRDGADYSPRFASRREAESQFFYARRLVQLKRSVPGAVDTLLSAMPEWPEPRTPACARLANRLAKRLGRRLEQRGAMEDALAVYRRGDSAHCIERQVRILLAEARRDAARDVLETSLDAPRSDEEWLFAQDLYRRTFGGERRSPMTELLREADCVSIDEVRNANPERAAVEHFRAGGAQAWVTENLLWRCLFGLVFWDLLFGDAAAAPHSPFDALPPALADRCFYADFEHAIESQLARCATAAGLQTQLLRVATKHYDTLNPLFRWQRETLDAALALARYAEPTATTTILRQLAIDFDQLHGFPDLLVVDVDVARFVEIKAPGDQLRRNQWVKLEQMRQAGFRVDVVRVEWFVDPAQTYVVVDVETTGGRSAAHRVTEIGAVKVRGDRVVDRFQSLVNPERPIPPHITRLTGITNEMVGAAPRFADIADALGEFIGDAIFVAHNVEFDYGFIRREFERVGRRFRAPKLCTCAAMRRWYPGQRSYSLKALCAAFDISLTSHHRALCDAEAAAELLSLVNERRAAVASAT